MTQNEFLRSIRNSRRQHASQGHGCFEERHVRPEQDPFRPHAVDAYLEDEPVVLRTTEFKIQVWWGFRSFDRLHVTPPCYARVTQQDARLGIIASDRWKQQGSA